MLGVIARHSEPDGDAAALAVRNESAAYQAGICNWMKDVLRANEHLR
jgi:hypothetical protein